MQRGASWLSVAAALFVGAGNLGAQQAEVSAAIEETLAAWREGRFEEFVAFYHPEARGFYLDGGPLAATFDLQALRAAHSAGFRADVTLRDLEVRVYGPTSVAAGYLTGALTLPGGVTLPGTWRYTETRVREEGVWKVVQFHFSAQGPTAGS